MKTPLRRTVAAPAAATPWGVVLKPVPRATAAPQRTEESSAAGGTERQTQKQAGNRRTGQDMELSVLKSVPSCYLSTVLQSGQDPSLAKPVQTNSELSLVKPATFDEAQVTSSHLTEVPAQVTSSDLSHAAQVTSSDLSQTAQVTRSDLSPTVQVTSSDLSLVTLVTSVDGYDILEPVASAKSSIGLKKSPGWMLNKKVLEKGYGDKLRIHTVVLCPFLPFS
jgi:hypothetical protein